MKYEGEVMFNQIRRIWADHGQHDKDFTPQELKLKEALMEVKRASDQLSRASTILLDLINSRG